MINTCNKSKLNHPFGVGLCKTSKKNGNKRQKNTVEEREKITKGQNK
jgi:hypothetical protein